MTPKYSSRRELEAEAGHPDDLIGNLKERIQTDVLTSFEAIADDWLSVVWSIDCYRVAGIVPKGMGEPSQSNEGRLGAVVRGKGNWFAEVLALLLQNQTTQQIRPRSKVQGFSQTHQIDLAWPRRELDPLVCAEVKVTGGPGYDSKAPRSALADFSNRRKEIKFAATDLKLYRRSHETTIDHWGVWRETAPPKTYLLWGSRLATDKSPPDRLDRVLDEARDLVDTYLDGAGVFSWKLRENHTGYEPAHLAASERRFEVDDVLYRMASEIKRLLGPSSTIPPPESPPS